MEPTKDQLANYKTLLLKRRAELESIAESSAQAAETVELDQARVGRISRMDALQGQAMAKESERRRQLELQRVASALNRMKEADYGWCLSCGEAILPARLSVDPCATQCVKCASARE